MAQHFLLSPAAKSLKLATVLRMSDEEARETFRKIRWAETDGEPVCPVCGCVESKYLETYRRWKCRGCSKQFSLTSGTIFHSRKLEVRNILSAIAIFTNGVKGYSALQLSRDLGHDYKTCYVMLHKCREAIGLAHNAGELEGVVEIDGAYFGGYVKPANKKSDRKNLTLSENKSGKRQSVIVMRERKGRTLAYVAPHEAAGVPMVRAIVKAGTEVHADEARHWDKLGAKYPIKRINHQQAYSLDGACTNSAESYFSRLRRCETGIHHHIAGPYLQAYAQEIAWREDMRRRSNGNQVTMIATATMAAPKSTQWCGYWQRKN